MKNNKYQTVYLEFDDGEVLPFHGPSAVKTSKTIKDVHVSQPKRLPKNVSFEPEGATLTTLWEML